MGNESKKSIESRLKRIEGLLFDAVEKEIRRGAEHYQYGEFGRVFRGEVYALVEEHLKTSGVQKVIRRMVKAKAAKWLTDIYREVDRGARHG